MTNKAVIFSAPSGAGKTTIVQQLLKKMDALSFSVSATSRAARGDEKNGVDYLFLSPQEFKQKIEDDDFVEFEEVYTDQFYGTLKSEVNRVWSQGKAVIFDVDVVGGVHLKSFFGENALAIFVMPPSIEELEKRLRGRQTESEEKIKMRLGKAKNELEFASKFDAILENKNLDQAVLTAETMITEFISK